MKIDYRAIGLKVGLEIHQRLEVGRKLFCHCKPRIAEDIVGKISRKQRPVPSELGEIDRAARFELLRDRTFIYQIYGEESCLVELDEEPPHLPSKKAIAVAIGLAKAFNMVIPDEIHVMRKIVVDGSNTSGFQRTMTVGIGTEHSVIETKYGPVRVKDLECEEESCGIVERKDGTVIYRLDRLGIPLVEIGTHPDIWHPEQAREAAEYIGLLCRLSGYAQRGLGTIRQDINLSVKGGARVEIKGLQDLALLPKCIELEARRQLVYIQIAKELDSSELKLEDVTEIFKGTSSKFAKKMLKKGFKAWSGVIRNAAKAFAKEVYPGVKVSTELAGYLKVAGIKGYIHSNEDLSKYGLEREFERLREKFSTKENDLIVVLFCREEDLKKTKYFISRISWLSKGVPEETRAANPDGTTSFLRPLPGAARMYPETDIPPIDSSTIEPVSVPRPEEMQEKLRKMNLSANLIDQLLHSHHLWLFLDATAKYKEVSPKLIARIILSAPGEVRKKYGIDVELSRDLVYYLLDAIKDKKIVRETVVPVMAEIAKNKRLESIDILLKRLNLTLLSPEEIETLIKTEFKNIPPQKLIGTFMAKYRGRVDVSMLKQIISKLK